jgi:hypothetical protein
MNHLWKILAGIVAATMFGYFAYGMVRFPDSPIHPCDDGRYCGKQGQPHTLKDYHAHQLWQTGLMWGWPLGMVALVLIKRKIPPTDWELMSPASRYRVLRGPRIDHDAIRKTYDEPGPTDKQT